MRTRKIIIKYKNNTFLVKVSKWWHQNYLRVWNEKKKLLHYKCNSCQLTISSHQNQVVAVKVTHHILMTGEVLDWRCIRNEVTSHSRINFFKVHFLLPKRVNFKTSSLTASKKSCQITYQTQCCHVYPRRFSRQFFAPQYPTNKWI